MKKKSNKPKISYPKPLSKRLVTEFALKNHADRPMIFWEKARVWDWVDLSLDEHGEQSHELLLERLSDLESYFSDEAVSDNKRSMAIIVKVTVPTQRDWLRICEKYGYETDLGGIDGMDYE